MLSTIKKNTILVSGFVVVLLLWSLVYLGSFYNILLVPSPIHVSKALAGFLIDKGFFISLGATILRVVVAFLISAVIGIVIGLILGYYNLLDKSTEKLVDFLRSIPGIALFPLFILMFGVSNVARVAVSIFATSLVILVNTKYGVINSSDLRKNFSKIYKIGRLKMFYKVILPEASPYIFTGLKVAVSLTVVLIIVTEMMLGTGHGLGQLLITSQYQFETDVLYATIIVLGSIGFILNSIFDNLEVKIFHWR